MSGRHSRTILAAAAFVLAISSANAASAIPPFWVEFEAKYVTPAGDKGKALADAKCANCHFGETKKVRNTYGVEIGKLLKKENFAKERLDKPEEAPKAKAEIIAALDAAAAIKSGDANSPTFGQLITEGKVPSTAEPAAAPPAATTAAPEKPIETPHKPLVMPEPFPVPAPSAEEAAAIAALQKLGGSVFPAAQNDGRRLIDFHLGGKELNDAGLAELKKITFVIFLNLKDTKVTDAGLANLAGNKTIQQLHLEQTAVTDEGLKHLVGLENLEYLNLYGTKVTDAGLDNLAGLKKLKKLYVWMTPVTDEGVKKLKEKLPELEIVK